MDIIHYVVYLAVDTFIQVFLVLLLQCVFDVLHDVILHKAAIIQCEFTVPFLHLFN